MRFKIFNRKIQLSQKSQQILETSYMHQHDNNSII